MKYKRKELLKLPHREWSNSSKEYKQILIVPAGLKHDSGYMCIAIIGMWVEDGEEKYEIAAMPDSISHYFPIRNIAEDLTLPTVWQDCYYPSGVLRYFGDGVFTVSDALSDVDIRFYPANQKGI